MRLRCAEPHSSLANILYVCVYTNCKRCSPDSSRLALWPQLLSVALYLATSAMSSYVYYKFKSQRAEKRIAFDGTGISVFDLKKEIILSNNFGKASEMDLLLFDSADKGMVLPMVMFLLRIYSRERGLRLEYADDNQIIPRSTSVIAKRMPASKPGKGKAAIYITGGGPSSGPSVRQDAKATPAPPVWNKSAGGAISKRFDGKDDKPRIPSASKSPVSSLFNQQSPYC